MPETHRLLLPVRANKMYINPYLSLALFTLTDNIYHSCFRSLVLLLQRTSIRYLSRCLLSCELCVILMPRVRGRRGAKGGGDVVHVMDLRSQR